MEKVICVISKHSMGNINKVEGFGYSSIKEAKKYAKYFEARNKAHDKIHNDYFGNKDYPLTVNSIEYKTAELIIK